MESGNYIGRAPAELSAIPVGTIWDFAGTVLPADWALCDGATYDRTVEPALFAVIGTTWGAPSGTQFQVPNLNGRVTLGVGVAGVDTYVLGGVGGEARHVLTTPEIPSHQHAITATISSFGPRGGAGSEYWGAAPQATNVAATGGGLEHENRQLYAAVVKMIRMR